MRLSDTVVYYLGGSVFALTIVATAFVSYQSDLKKAREQGFEEGQQHTIRFTRRNLEAMLNIDCKTDDKETYNLQLFHPLRSDPNNYEDVGGLAMQMYCPSSDSPRYPQVPKAYSPQVIQIEIAESAVGVRWKEFEQHFNIGGVFQGPGLKKFRERNQVLEDQK